MRHAIFLPPFGELADPRCLVDLAVAAEANGWDGMFLWDHILRPRHEPAEVADVWICLAAVATATTSLRIGPMVTPIVRRRPQKLAREALTLDHLSRGRVTLGLGIGIDGAGELSKFGEVTDARHRGDILDEGAELLVKLWSGEAVNHRGAAFVVDDVTYLPRPVQSPHIPLWLASGATPGRPARRAARYNGIFPMDVDVDGLRRLLDVVAAERGSLDGFDVAVQPTERSGLAALAAAGATWGMTSWWPGCRAAEVAEVISRGPESA